MHSFFRKELPVIRAVILPSLFLLLFLLMQPQNSMAQTVTAINDLDFGEAIVTNNSGQYSINVQANGFFTADSAFIFIENPREGFYKVRDLPPSILITNISVSIDQQMNGPGEDFIIDNFDISAPSFSDANGELDIYLGARLRTSGNNNNYLYNSTFRSTLTLFINY